MAVSINDFGKALVAAGLMSAEQVQAFWKEIPADQKAKGIEGLASALVATGKLTSYQSQELLAGHSKSLVLGNYLVLDRIGAGGMGQVMGTIDYMAPEQALNTRPAAARADVYSLGCTLYWLLTGESPFGGETMMEKLLAHREQPIPWLNTRRSDVPAPLEAIYYKMMAKESTDRYQTMADVVTDREEWKGAETRGTTGAGATKNVGQDSKLSAFLNTMSAPKPTKMQAKGVATARRPPAPASGTEATISFHNREVGTDPKSGHNLSVMPVPPLHKASGPPSKRPPVWIMAIGGGGLAILLLFGVWLIVRDKDGKVTGQVEIPGGGTMSLENRPGNKSNTPPTTTKSTFPGTTTGIPPIVQSPFNAEEAKKHQEAWANYLDVELVKPNSIGMKMVLIPPGEFLIGSSDDDITRALKIAEETKLDDYGAKRIQEERPQHPVRIAKPFRLCAHEVTIGQFAKFVDQSSYKTVAEEFGGNSSTLKAEELKPENLKFTWRTPGQTVTDESPVTQVTWNDAVAFCNWLSDQEKLEPCYRRDGDTWILTQKTTGYHLPTEAEWEYACRAGTTTQYSFGDDWTEMGNFGWSNKNAGGRPRSVGQLPANPFGLYDMHGNVWEWCSDNYDSKWYEKSSKDDPLNPPSGSSPRVVRGGCWGRVPAYGRSSFRYHSTPASRSNDRGFRPSLCSVGSQPSK